MAGRYSDDDYDDYSDDFASDDDRHTPLKSAPEKRRSPANKGEAVHFDAYFLSLSFF